MYLYLHDDILLEQGMWMQKRSSQSQDIQQEPQPVIRIYSVQVYRSKIQPAVKLVHCKILNTDSHTVITIWWRNETMLSHYIYILSIQKRRHWPTVGTYIWKCSSCNRNRGSARPYALQDCGTGHFKTQKTRMNRVPALTPEGNVGRPGVALLEQWNQVAWNEISPESGAAYQLIWTEQKTVSCGRKIMNETLLLVVKILALTSLPTDVFVTLLQ